MSDIIQLLPDSVANQIAAGEVIQRPASVIKELVENSIDAGAKTINVLVTDAGRTSIQVIDDGCGMSETDARMSFERHATSKIRKADDLFALHTMGFRGEALASIAAVAQVELRTRTQADDIGTHLSVAASKVTGQEPVSCPVGTNFSVENLFYNVPARRKFLKSNATELNNIITAFERIALVYPGVSFTLHSNGSELFNLKSGNLRQRVVDIFGKKINADLLPIGVETTICSIKGFVGKPEAARKRGAHQYFFVNGRIDVNIHPTKTEIKFENEQTVWQVLLAAVKDAIGRFNDVPSIDFDTEGKPDIPVFEPGNGFAQMPKVDYNPSYNPFKSSQSYVPKGQGAGSAEGWESLYGDAVSGGFDDMQDGSGSTGGLFGAASDADNGAGVAEEKSPAHYQYKGKYIMTSVKSGLMMQMEGRGGASQQTLFPEMVTFTPSEDVMLQKMRQDLDSLGFDLAPLGGGSYSINGVPAGLDGVDFAKMLKNMLAEYAETGISAADGVRRMLALQLARGAAIPYGQVLNNAEMENIVNELFTCSNVNYSPDGKAAVAVLKQQDIERLFG